MHFLNFIHELGTCQKGKTHFISVKENAVWIQLSYCLKEWLISPSATLIIFPRNSKTFSWPQRPTSSPCRVIEWVQRVTAPSSARSARKNNLHGNINNELNNRIEKYIECSLDNLFLIFKFIKSDSVPAHSFAFAKNVIIKNLASMGDKVVSSIFFFFYDIF